jgi:hypothetical protein
MRADVRGYPSQFRTRPYDVLVKIPHGAGASTRDLKA